MQTQVDGEPIEFLKIDKGGENISSQEDNSFYYLSFA